MNILAALLALLIPILGGKGPGAAQAPSVPGVPPVPAPAPPVPISPPTPSEVTEPVLTDTGPAIIYPMPVIEPETPIDLPVEPPAGASYESWNNYYDALRIAYQHNYQVAYEQAIRHGGPLPVYQMPFTDQERLEKLESLQPVYDGHVYTDEEIWAYARLHGLTFLSAKTAITRGMFLG